MIQSIEVLAEDTRPHRTASYIDLQGIPTQAQGVAYARTIRFPRLFPMHSRRILPLGKHLVNIEYISTRATCLLANAT